MNISLNWLNQYIAFDPEDLDGIAKKMTMAGLEVEAINRGVKIPETIVVGEILERAKHPNADKLSVCKVNIGSQVLQIVCGAPNCDAGNKVPVAVLGTVMPSPKGPFTIEEVKLRGVESFGMMCSARELQLSDEHTGLLILDSALIPGTPVHTLFQTDTVLELEVTPNRADWLSHWGVARDLAVLIDTDARFPAIKPVSCTTPPPESLVTVENTELCPRYGAVLIRNVKVGESPEWMKARLSAIGLRPINNVVDITNYVLHELGTPLHAFDFDLLSGGKIIVRNARLGEKIVTLDGKERPLKPDYLVIADAEKPVVLAGVMGGENSGVTMQTKNVLLETAWFNPSQIRRTAREVGLSSDSSYRYERGVDRGMLENACARAVNLICELTGGEVAFAPCVVETPAEPMPEVPIDFHRINALLETDAPAEKMAEILRRLGVTLTKVTPDTATAQAPTYRMDLTREADFAEEIIRIWGLDQLPQVAPKAVQGGIQRDDTLYPQQVLRQGVNRLGFDECYTYSMVDEKAAYGDPSFPKDAVIAIDNPLNADMACLRGTLFVSMLRNVGLNMSRQSPTLRLFELGKVFCANAALYPEERMELAMAMTGERIPGALSSESRILDFYDLKGAVEALANERRVRVTFSAGQDPRFKKGTCARIELIGKTVGFMGEVAAEFTKGLRLKHPLFMAVMQADIWLNAVSPVPQLKSGSPFPPTVRDIAFLAPEKLEHKAVLEFIRKQKVPNLEHVELFDIFRDKKTLGDRMKSMAYAFTFRHAERTLTDDEVNQAYHALRDALAKALDVTLR